VDPVGGTTHEEKCIGRNLQRTGIENDVFIALPQLLLSVAPLLSSNFHLKT